MADHDNFLSSSSDDGLPAGLTVNTTPETRACNMRMLANVGESLNRIKTDSQAIFSKFVILEQTIGQCLSCKVCGRLANVPFVLECTHIYCFECLAKHLETTRKRFLRNQCWYRPREDYIHALRQPLSNPKVYLEAMEWIRVNPTPDYRCVFCCNPIARKPIQDFTLQTITEGFSQDREKAISGGGAHERIVGVDGLFDKYLLF